MNGVSQKSNLRVDLHIDNFAIESQNTSQVKPHPQKDECQVDIQGHSIDRPNGLPQTASDCLRLRSLPIQPPQIRTVLLNARHDKRISPFLPSFHSSRLPLLTHSLPN